LGAATADEAIRVVSVLSVARRTPVESRGSADPPRDEGA